MIARLLAARAATAPERTFLRTAAGAVTYAEACQTAARLAAGLTALGIVPGQPVVVLMRNSIEQVLLWVAVDHVGAVHVPVNTALVGDGLAHTFRVTDAQVAVVDADLLPQLLAITEELPRLRTVLVGGTAQTTAAGPTLVPLADVASCTAPPPPIADRDPLDAALMLFTSGTTGRSKACVLSERYVQRQAELHAEQLQLTSSDTLYTPFPLFHIDAATLTVGAALSVGGTAALGVRFSLSRFWDEVRAFDATVFNFMGATLTLLWKQQPSPRDRDHAVRLAWGVPMPEWKAAFETRFGFPLYEVYGLTDAGVPVYDPLDAPHRVGACGRVIDAYEVAIADEDGRPLPSGEVGEILIRGREPGLVMNGYHAMPEVTQHAFRGGWFHTGDLGRLDADGYLTFTGRMKDVIRRRGENISALEVEQAVEAHPAVQEAAAVGVPSPLTEEDVKVCVVLRPGASLDPAELVDFLTDRIARHMVPRYVEVVDALPRTPTEKVEKFRLAEAGVTDRTWDREGSDPAACGRIGGDDDPPP